MPLISVIIPVYNGEKTIRDTIDSVLQQTFSEFELLVIDDGSKDATLKVVSEISDPRLKVFSFPNAGASASRNRGLKLATGEYVSFIDADDLWTADKLQAQLTALQSHPAAAVAYSWTDCIDETGKFLRPSSHATASGNVYPNLLLTNIVGSGSNILVRREAIVAIGGFNEAIPPSVEDWELAVRLAARYEFVAVPSVQVLYRVYPNSASFNIERMEVMGLQATEALFAQAPEDLQYLKRPKTGNLYKLLVSKLLQGPVNRQNGLLAAKYLWKVVETEPSLIRRRLTWRVLVIIFAIALLPSQVAEAVLVRLNRRLGSPGLLPLICTNPNYSGF